MTREEKIIQANRDYEEAKRLLNVQYAEYKMDCVR